MIQDLYMPPLLDILNVFFFFCLQFSLYLCIRYCALLQITQAQLADAVCVNDRFACRTDESLCADYSGFRKDEAAYMAE